MGDFYYAATDGIRITVMPVFAPHHSDPAEPRYLFVYRVRIENVGTQPAQLLWRHWYIHDDLEGDSEVEGEGVVGAQPLLTPGQVHEYESFCVLKGTSGWMEGYYEFEREDGSPLKAAIPRFELKAVTV